MHPFPPSLPTPEYVVNENDKQTVLELNQVIAELVAGLPPVTGGLLKRHAQECVNHVVKRLAKLHTSEVEEAAKAAAAAVLAEAEKNRVEVKPG